MKTTLCLLAASLCFPVAAAYSASIEVHADYACTTTEFNANVIAASIADYFAIPSHTTLGTTPIVLGSAGGPPKSGGVSDMTFPALKGNNTAEITGDIKTVIIKVTDNSDRCPTEYQAAHAGWNGAGVYTKTL